MTNMVITSKLESFCMTNRCTANASIKGTMGVKPFNMIATKANKVRAGKISFPDIISLKCPRFQKYQTVC